jgi:hypothetical protein
VDVAGGKGNLSLALVKRGIKAALVDPCAITGRGGTLVFTPPVYGDGLCSAATNDSDDSDVIVISETLSSALNTHATTIRLCTALVGLHPDEATEQIVTTALSLQKPFAVVPCCVLHNLFPNRVLYDKHGNASGVRKVGAFIQYLLAMDPRMRTAKLDINGRNIVVFMTAADYSRSKTVPVMGDRECNKAAKLGQLEKLKALRSAGKSWSCETTQCAAFSGHVEILAWLRENGCPWDESTIDTAMLEGKEDVLEYAVRMECPGYAKVGATVAAS